MAKAARKYVPKSGLIEQTMGDPEFRKTIERGLTTAWNRIFRGGELPVDYEGYVGQRMYFDGTYHLANELAPYGFTHRFVSGQHRLISPDHFGCTLCLTVHTGTAQGQIVKFKWPKGIVVSHTILENKLNHSPLQPGLFDLRRRNVFAAAKRLNFGIACDVSPKRLRSWMFLGVELLSKRILECAELVPVCDLSFGQADIPDFASTPTTSSIDMEFGEK